MKVTLEQLHQLALVLPENIYRTLDCEITENEALNDNEFTFLLHILRHPSHFSAPENYLRFLCSDHFETTKQSLINKNIIKISNNSIIFLPVINPSLKSSVMEEEAEAEVEVEEDEEALMMNTFMKQISLKDIHDELGIIMNQCSFMISTLANTNSLADNFSSLLHYLMSKSPDEANAIRHRLTSEMRQLSHDNSLALNKSQQLFCNRLSATFIMSKYSREIMVNLLQKISINLDSLAQALQDYPIKVKGNYPKILLNEYAINHICNYLSSISLHVKSIAEIYLDDHPSAEKLNTILELAAKEKPREYSELAASYLNQSTQNEPARKKRRLNDSDEPSQSAFNIEKKFAKNTVPKETYNNEKLFKKSLALLFSSFNEKLTALSQELEGKQSKLDFLSTVSPRFVTPENIFGIGINPFLIFSQQTTNTSTTPDMMQRDIDGAAFSSCGKSHTFR